jgi:heme-degrading monooxygenase HmoA
MHARVSTYQATDTDGLLDGFKGVTGDLERMDGFSHGYFMVDPASGKAMSITIWDSEEALNASVAKADELRARGTQPSRTEIKSVEHYAIPVTAGAIAGSRA